MTYRLFIGADNTTGDVDLPMIELILNKRHKGYTIERATGYWLGRREQSVIVTIADSDKKIMQSVAELKEALKQDAIGYQLTADLFFA